MYDRFTHQGYIGKSKAPREVRQDVFLGYHHTWESLCAAEFDLHLSLRLAAGVLLLASIPRFLSAQEKFFLKEGDTVVFYGDSITERRIYTSFVEAYVLTRFPKLNVRFVNSGWGGDTVAGGAGGSLEVRLQRDVIAYQPTVVTILLGMNDGRYRVLSESTYGDFTTGYEKLINILKGALPNVRLTLLEPSPYDDVTRPVGFPGGYNGVLTRFGQFIRALGERDKIMVVDLNSAVVGPLMVVNVKDPSAAREFVPDRVHPGPAASLLMAEALLKSWNAPAVVTEVEIDAESGTASRTVRTEVDSILRTSDTLSWTQNDATLPFPVDWQDSPVRVAAYSSDFIPAIDDQPLRVKNLKPGDYTLEIDGQAIATYPADQFARGINLSVLETPMLKQAAEVLKLTNQHNDVHVGRWRLVQVPLAQYTLPHYDTAIANLDALEQEAVARQRVAAQPKPHVYRIVTTKNAGRRN
jgi:lysophospholipase L1-like esterase